jgi:Tfp pilus assembly protein PilN
VYQTTQETRALELEVQNAQSRIAEHINNQKAKQALSTDTDLSKENLKALGSVIKQLNVPWQDIFKQLEKTMPPDIALLSIEPDAQRGLIRLQAEAESLDSLLRYASSLQNYSIFGRLYYSKHETNEQDPNKPVRLSFELGLSAPNRLAKPGPTGMQGNFE